MLLNMLYYATVLYRNFVSMSMFVYVSPIFPFLKMNVSVPLVSHRGPRRRLKGNLLKVL